MALFQVTDSTTWAYNLLGENGGTFNNTPATDGSLPLLSDPVLYAGLPAGDYYLAVFNNSNLPDPVYYPPGPGGPFDPTVSHSGQNGGPTGNYVLNVQVQPVADPPQVLAVSIAEGDLVGVRK